MKIEYAKLDARAIVPTRAHPGDAGMDLYAIEMVSLAPGERASVGTGIAIAIPEGYAGLILPRSGLAARDGITLPNAPGLIDAGYRGELRVLLLNTDREKAFQVRLGDRIAQLMITPVPEVRLVMVESLGESSRGPEGFGSTGR